MRPGVESYKRARLLLVQYDREGNGLSLPHCAVSVIGTQEWDSYNNYFTINPETKKIIVLAQLSKSTGAFWLKNIHLYPVIQTHVYIYFKILYYNDMGCLFSLLTGALFF